MRMSNKHLPSNTHAKTTMIVDNIVDDDAVGSGGEDDANDAEDNHDNFKAKE